MLISRNCLVLVALAIGITAIAGCSASPPAPTAVASVREDTFLPYREISTASFDIPQALGGRIRGHLTARLAKSTGAVTTHAVVGVVYAQKLGRRYEQARNARAESLPFRLLAHDGNGCRKQTGCAHLELFQIDIPEADLRRAAASGEGYPIKMFGRAGAATLFPFPPDLVRALVKNIDASPATNLAQKAAPAR